MSVLTRYYNVMAKHRHTGSRLWEEQAYLKKISGEYGAFQESIFGEGPESVAGKRKAAAESYGATKAEMEGSEAYRAWETAKGAYRTAREGYAKDLPVAQQAYKSAVESVYGEQDWDAVSGGAEFELGGEYGRLTSEYENLPSQMETLQKNFAGSDLGKRMAPFLEKFGSYDPSDTFTVEGDDTEYTASSWIDKLKEDIAPSEAAISEAETQLSGWKAGTWSPWGDETYGVDELSTILSPYVKQFEEGYVPPWTEFESAITKAKEALAPGRKGISDLESMLTLQKELIEGPDYSQEFDWNPRSPEGQGRTDVSFSALMKWAYPEGDPDELDYEDYTTEMSRLKARGEAIPGEREDLVSLYDIEGRSKAITDLGTAYDVEGKAQAVKSAYDAEAFSTYRTNLAQLSADVARYDKDIKETYQPQMTKYEKAITESTARVKAYGGTLEQLGLSLPGMGDQLALAQEGRKRGTRESAIRRTRLTSRSPYLY